MSNLNAKQKKFAEIYAETNDAVQAYKVAYLEDSKKEVKYLKSTAFHKLDNPGIRALIDDIQQAMRAQYVMLAPEALDNLVDLATNAENEKVKLDANREILHGAGMRPVEEVTLKAVGIFGGVSLSEIKERLRQNMEEVVEAEVVDAN